MTGVVVSPRSGEEAPESTPGWNRLPSQRRGALPRLLSRSAERPAEPGVRTTVVWVTGSGGRRGRAGCACGSRRRLARRRRKEQRHATQVNHRISKEIVSVAQRTGRGIAVEALGGIRERVRLRRDQRGALSSWPFHQLGQHLADKARRAGVPFLEVDAAHTSQRCPRCGHTERANRPDRDHFRCRRCGLAGPADVVAGVNVRDRARSAWVLVTAPAPSP
ncbi:transposase [Streptomyces sparsogenes]|uniref:transposase n=1 Tax=Streptomyces sparsogenes TaxID=67365 RepID=UPI0033CB3A74